MNEIVIVSATRTPVGAFNGAFAKKGLATLCIGGGMGIAMCVER
jgi:acetyl-CoA acetyltransferase